MTELALLVQIASHLLQDGDRQTHGIRLIGDAAQDALSNPPRRIGREAKAAFGIEPVGGRDEAEIPFADEIQEIETAVAIAARDENDEAQVAQNEPATGRGVAGARGARRRELVLRGERRMAMQIGEIAIEGIDVA